MSDSIPALAGVAAVLSVVSKLAEIAKNVKSSEMRAQLAEVQQNLLDLQQELGRVIDDNDRLKREARERDKLAEIEADLEFTTDGHFYIRKSEKDKGLVPYCPVCWGKRELVHLRPYGSPGLFRCDNHKSCYWTAEHEEWKKRQASQPRVIRSAWMDRWFER